MLEIRYAKLGNIKASLFQGEKRNLLLVNDAAGFTREELLEIKRRAERSIKHSLCGLRFRVSVFIDDQFDIWVDGVGREVRR